MIITGQTPESATASAELQEFLLQLGLCVQRYAMYPGGHPSLDAAVARLRASAARLLEGRETLSLGVARRQIVVEGTATDASNRVLRALAERLHRHRLGAVVVRRGVDADELRSVARALSRDADRDGPLGAGPDTGLLSWPHVRLYRVTYEQLQLAAQEEEDEAAGFQLGAGTASVQLWLGLARAAIARGEALEAEGALDEAAVKAAPEQVAEAINEHGGAQAYDQAIVGYLLQLTDELRRNGSGRTAKGVRRRLSRMVKRLEPGTLQRLLEMGGNGGQRHQFLSHAVDTLEPDAVLELLNAALASEGQSVSTSMLRMLRKLAAHVDEPGEPGSERAEREVREQMHSLLSGWRAEDPNPTDYTHVLESIAGRSSIAAVKASRHAPDALRIVQLCLETGAVGSGCWRAVDALLEEGRLNDLLDVLDGAPADSAAAEPIWTRLETGDAIRTVIMAEPVDSTALDRLLARMPASSALSLLLDRLSESTSRHTRMSVFRRVGAHGIAAVPAVIERFADTRWFVLRNMLALLNEIGTFPREFSPLMYTTHGELKVRREAYQLAVRVPEEREEAITRALAEGDERCLRIGLAAARQHGLPGRGVASVVRRLNDASLSGELHATMLRVLAGSAVATKPAVDRMVHFASTGRSLLRRPRLADKSLTMLAAVEALAAAAPHTSDSRVRPLLDAAQMSPDPEIRTASRSPIA